MYVQVVIYDAGMMGQQEYIDLAYSFAPQIATVPGLMAAVWLDGSDAGAYGAVFFWEDRAAMERFTQSQLFASTFGTFPDVSIAHGNVLENVTRETQPSLQVVPMAEGATGLPPAGLEVAEVPAARRRGVTAKRTGPGKKIAAPAKRAAKKTAARKTAAGKKKPAPGKKKPASAGAARSKREASTARKASTAKTKARSSR